MIVQDHPPLHLAYCLNIHRGETWTENLADIRQSTLAVRDAVAPGEPFGLGLRLSHRAAVELSEPANLAAARDFFRQENLYAFTINGFPYGQFHGVRVKENVYAPDWRTTERRDYTNLLADILASLLPEGIEGSISTVPCSFKPWIRSAADRAAMVENLSACAAHLAEIHERTGRLIHLGLEPEPACFLETTAEAIAFFEELFRSPHLPESTLRRHVGVCFDTCHVAVQFEDVAESFCRYRSAGILISKVQLSAALRAEPTAESLRELEAFCEPVYLHQVKARARDGMVSSWLDLPEALRDLAQNRDAVELRVHFHVPLFTEGMGALRSTASTLTPEFFALLRSGATSHIEVETYTFDVLPSAVRPAGVVECITRELEWARMALKR
jgi:hypothetical protein